VVECGSLENYCAATYRGFESLSLRNAETQIDEKPCKPNVYKAFSFKYTAIKSIKEQKLGVLFGVVLVQPESTPH
jgi:hypothetical protein